MHSHSGNCPPFSQLLLACCQDEGERKTKADSDDDGDGGQFANLDSNRISLKGVTHASYAKDSGRNGVQS